MKNEVKERRIVKIQYFLDCPIIGCKKKEVKGNSKSQVLYNLRKHIKAHSKVKSNREESKKVKGVKNV